MEESWLTIALVRLCTLTNYEGGISRFTRECLGKYFYKAGANDFHRTGMFLPIDGADVPLRALIWAFVGANQPLRTFSNARGTRDSNRACFAEM